MPFVFGKIFNRQNYGAASKDCQLLVVPLTLMRCAKVVLMVNLERDMTYTKQKALLKQIHESGQVAFDLIEDKESLGELIRMGYAVLHRPVGLGFNVVLLTSLGAQQAEDIMPCKSDHTDALADALDKMIKSHELVSGAPAGYYSVLADAKAALAAYRGE